jgi:hypothetical protein
MTCLALDRIIIRCTMKRASLHLIVNSICCAKIRTTDKVVDDFSKSSDVDEELQTKSAVITAHKDGDSTDSFSD